MKRAAVSFALAAPELALAVLGTAWVLRPRECFGICYVDPHQSHQAQRCPAYDPAVLFYRRTAQSEDAPVLSALVRGQDSKGFNVVSLPAFPRAAPSA